MSELAGIPIPRRSGLLLVALVAASLITLAGAARHAYGSDLSQEVVVQSVGTQAYPTTTVRCTVPASLLESGKQPSFKVFENGQSVGDVSVRPLAGAQLKPVSVVLVMDTSGSMKGQPLADAKAAARRFIDRMRPQDPIALVGFDSRPRTLVGFTTDRAAVLHAVDGLRTAGETALYDALSQAVDLVASAPAGQRTIVVLSDGGDTVSSNTVDSVLPKLRSRGVPVYGVALQSNEADFAGLTQIARLTGARFTMAAASGALGGIYEDLAQEIQSQFELRYHSPGARTKELQIDVFASAGKQTVNGWTIVPNSGLGRAVSTSWLMLPFLGGPAEVTMLVVLFVAAFGAMGLLAYGLMLVLVPERDPLDQLSFYDQLRATAETASERKSALETAVMDVVGEVAGRRGFTQLATQRLERAGLPLRPVEYIFFHLVAVVLSGFVVQLLSGRILLSLGAVILATVGPLYLLELLGRRRCRKFDDQLPDLLNLIAGSLRAGYGLLQAIGLVVEEMSAPASVEFRRVQTEARLGLRLEDALDKMADRLDSVDFRWAVMAMNIQREVGGNLAEILDIVAKTVRERDALRRHVSSLTAEGRLSAIVLTTLPFFVAAVLFVTSPSYILNLVSEPVGRVMVGMSLVSLAIGAVWLQKVTEIEV